MDDHGKADPGISRRTLLKRGAAIGGVAIAAPLVAACQGGSTPPAAGSPGRAGPVTIRVWGFGLDDDRAKARLDVFKKKNPNITVESVGGTLNRQQLLTAVASGDPPEVVRINRNETSAWAARLAIDPIQDLVDRDKFDVNEFSAAAVAQARYKNQLYGLPEFAHVELLFINTEALNEAGVKVDEVDSSNWDKMIELGEKLHKRQGDKVVRTGFDSKMQDGRLWQWAWANGAEPISADGDKAQFNDAKIIEAVTWGKNVVEKQGGERARAAFSQTQNFFSPQNPILIGQIAITSFESWLIGTVKVNANAPIKTMLIRKRNSRDVISAASGASYAIPRGVKGDKREAAWAFIRDFTSAEGRIAGEKASFTLSQSKGEKYHPTNTGNEKADEVVQNEIYKAGSIGPAFDEMVKLWPEARKAARYPYSGPVATEVGDELTKQMNDALQGVKDPKKAMDDLTAAAQKQIDDFKKGPGNR
jgi:multiple sugar transport system substrate-binding protein